METNSLLGDLPWLSLENFENLDYPIMSQDVEDLDLGSNFVADLLFSSPKIKLGRDFD